MKICTKCGFRIKKGQPYKGHKQCWRHADSLSCIRPDALDILEKRGRSFQRRFKATAEANWALLFASACYNYHMGKTVRKSA